MEEAIKEYLEEMHGEMQALRSEVRGLRTLIENTFGAFRRPPERVDDLVTVDYIVQRTGYARRTILEGKAGFKSLPHLGGKPRKYRRGDVDKWLHERSVQKKEYPRLLS